VMLVDVVEVLAEVVGVVGEVVVLQRERIK